MLTTEEWPTSKIPVAKTTDEVPHHRYASVVAVHHYHTKEAFLLADYFIPRSERFFLFTYGQASDFGSSNAIQFWEYARGTPVRQKVLVHNQIGSFFLRYAQLIFWFTWFAVRHAPRCSWLIVPHPPLTLVAKALWWIRRQQTVLILQDIFDYDPSRLTGRLFNGIVRRRAQSVDYVLYLSPAIQERHDLPTPPGRSPPRLRKRWTFGIRKRFDESELASRPDRLSTDERITVGYVGVVRSSAGLESLIEIARLDPRVHLDIVGEGVYTALLRKRSEESGVGSRVTFHGFLPTDKLDALSRAWLCGTMLYDTVGDIYSRYGEPAKAKLYLSLGVPILMTDVSYVVDEVRRFNAGMVIGSNDPAEVAKALAVMKTNYVRFVRGVAAMATAYDYERKYAEDFAFMERMPDARPAGHMRGL